MKHSSIILMALAVSIIAGCGPKQQEEVVEDRVELVETTTLQKREINRKLDFSTNLQGYQTMNISPSVTGKIDHIFVEVGAQVAKGQMLVRMDQNQFNTTSLTYANLGVEIERIKTLLESGAVSQQTYDQTKLSYDQTKTSLDFLEKNTFVKAEFSGVISAKNYEDGELYSGQPILVLTQISTLKALINIPESYYPEIKKGMSVQILSDIYPGEVFPASIEIVYPTVDAASHTFQAKLRIPNSNQKLRPGMYVHSAMEMGKATAMVIPYQSVQKMTGSNDRYVFINEDGVAKRIFVKLGQRFDEDVEVISDELAEGDQLVTVGQAKLVDGSKLNVVKEN